jgi:hypothetical protein
MWSNIRAGLGPARPNEGTAWFRAGLGHCFYTSGWHGTAQKLFGLFGPNPFGTKHDGLGPGRPGTAQFLALRYTMVYGGTIAPTGPPHPTRIRKETALPIYKEYLMSL